MGPIILCLIVFFAIPSFIIVSFLINRNDELNDKYQKSKDQNSQLLDRNKKLDAKLQHAHSLIESQNKILNNSTIRNNNFKHQKQ